MRIVLEWRHLCYKSEYQRESRSCQGRRSLSNQTGSCNKLVRNCWQRRRCVGTSWVLSHYQHCNKKRGKTPEREIQQLFLKKNFGGHQLFFSWGGVTDTTVLDFWWHSILSFKAKVDSLTWVFCFLHATDSSDSPLVWHLLTSWQPAWWMKSNNFILQYSSQDKQLC